MKTRLLALLGLWVILGAVFISCTNTSGKSVDDPFADAEWVNFIEEPLKFKKPNRFKRSSRYRIKEDLPSLSEDQGRLELVQNSLEMLEFKDAEIDLFVDTTADFRLLIMCNVARIDFNRNDVAMIKAQISHQNREYEGANPVIKYGKLSAKMNQNSNVMMAKLKSKLTNQLTKSSTYNSIYYLTTVSRTVIVYEFSDTEKDIEKYLWTLKYTGG